MSGNPGTTIGPESTDYTAGIYANTSARVLAGIALVIIAALIYAFTLDNGLNPAELHGGDLITHQYAQVEARPSNAPGYPLYTIGGWAWFHGIRAALEAAGIADTNPIPILSGFSTLWALIALWLLYEIICMATESVKRTVGNWPIAFLVSLFYSVTYFFWYYATTTEQYSSAVAQTLAIVFVLMLWLKNREALWLLFVLAFVCGISLAHMLTVAFIVPPVVLSVIWADPTLLRKPKAVIGSLIAAATPLISYAFVYIRGSQHPEWWGSEQYESAGRWFWSFVSTSQGREELMWAFEPGRPLLGNGFPSLVGQELSWLMVIAGLIGIGLLRRPLPFVLYSTLAIYVLFSWFYRFGNWFQVILPAYALILIGVGAVADRWQTYATERRRVGSQVVWRRAIDNLLVIAPALLLVLAISWRYDASVSRANSRNRAEDTALDRAAILLSAPLPPDSSVFASVDDALALQYLINIWGLRPDIEVITSREAEIALMEQPVFSTWDAAPTLDSEINRSDNLRTLVFSPDWVQFYPDQISLENIEGINEQRTIVPLDTHLTDQAWLEAYDVIRVPDDSPVIDIPWKAYDVTFYWHLPEQQWPDGLAVSVRPTVDGNFIPDPDSPGGVIQVDHAMPAQLQFNFGNDPQPSLIPDPYRIQFPNDTGAADSGIALLLYRQTENGFEDVARLDLSLPQLNSTQ